jgi:hypothetical protein
MQNLDRSPELQNGVSFQGKEMLVTTGDLLETAALTCWQRNMKLYFLRNYAQGHEDACCSNDIVLLFPNLCTWGGQWSVSRCGRQQEKEVGERSSPYAPNYGTARGSDCRVACIRNFGTSLQWVVSFALCYRRYLRKIGESLHQLNNCEGRLYYDLVSFFITMIASQLVS